MKVIEVDFDLSTTFNLNVVVERNLRCPLYCCEQCDQMSSLFFNIWPITSMKICPMAYKICQSRLKNMQYTQKTFEIFPENISFYKGTNVSKAFFILPTKKRCPVWFLYGIKKKEATWISWSVFYLVCFTNSSFFPCAGLIMSPHHMVQNFD